MHFSPLSRPLSSLLLASILFTATSVHSQLPNMRSMPAEYEALVTRLRNAEPMQYDFSNAVLSDVLRFLATDAGISFFSLPNDSTQGSSLVTFSISASPFKVLETLCKANGLAIIPDNDIWYIRPADDRELIGKSYEVRHNALERVEKITGAGLLGSGGAGGGGGANTSAAGLSLQGPTDSFAVQRSEIINSIRSILDLPPEEVELALNGMGGAGGGMGGMMGGMGGMGGGMGGMGGGAMGGQQNPNAAAMASNSNELSAWRRPKVIWMSDSNTLYVVATRLQHLWVEGFLEAADKVQPMIAIEVKFLETNRDPRREFGVDWTGTFENGTFRQVTEVRPETGPDGTTFNAVTQELLPTSGGFRTDLAPLLTGVDLNDIANTLQWPQFSLLSAQDVNVKLRALLRDETTTTTSYPRMVTLNNREVQIRSVVNQPVLAASSSATLGTGATTTNAIEYLPIGTVLNILPKKMESDKVHLNMAITVSTIIGNEIISGNPYPIASSRVYSAPVEVNSGYTVAVGGLNEARERDGETGIPFLSRIPILGYAFKYKNRARNQKNLLLFITPTLIDARDGGLPDEPQAVKPIKPDGMPSTPQIDQENGVLIGGADAVPNAVAYMEREFNIIEQTVAESRGTDDDTKKLKELGTAIDHLRGQIEAIQLSEPHRAEEMRRYDHVEEPQPSVLPGGKASKKTSSTGHPSQAIYDASMVAAASKRMSSNAWLRPPKNTGTAEAKEHGSGAGQRIACSATPSPSARCRFTTSSKKKTHKKVFVCNGSACLCAGTQDQLHHELETHFKTPGNRPHLLPRPLPRRRRLPIPGPQLLRPARQLPRRTLHPNRQGRLKDRYAVVSLSNPPAHRRVPRHRRLLRPLQRAHRWQDRDWLAAELKDSGLRGRGGAGFPLHLKWQSCRETPARIKYIVCNADEGDPGAYIDKYLMEERPHSVLLGMMVGRLVRRRQTPACSTSAPSIPTPSRIINEAIEDLRAAGLLGKNIQGSGFNFEFKTIKGRRRLHLRRGNRPARQHRRSAPRGPRAPAVPHRRRPLPQTHHRQQRRDLRQPPRHPHPRWQKLRPNRHPQSHRTKLLSLDSHFVKPGIYEVAMGTPLAGRHRTRRRLQNPSRPCKSAARSAASCQSATSAGSRSISKVSNKPASCSATPASSASRNDADDRVHPAPVPVHRRRKLRQMLPLPPRQHPRQGIDRQSPRRRRLQNRPRAADRPARHHGAHQPLRPRRRRAAADQKRPSTPNTSSETWPSSTFL
jgi:type II secretory pathway component GspD/PulD (secretin)